MEIKTRVRVKNYQEIRDYFKFDEILDIRFMEQVGEKTYKVVIRLPECHVNIGSSTTLKRIKEKVLEACAKDYPIKSKVVFANGTERIIHASTDYWESEYAWRFAERDRTSVVKIERMEG